jgi:pyruvate dehydrogenase (quinone)
MAKKVADLLVDALAEAGVKQIYGVSGDSLNGITDSLRENKTIQWIHIRHEDSRLRRKLRSRELASDQRAVRLPS